MYKTAQTKTIICAIVASAVLATAAQAQTLRVASALAETHWYSKNGFEVFMNCVQEGTQGAIDFDYFPGETLLKRDQGISGLKDGLADISFVQIPDESANLPIQSLLLLPGLATNASQNAQTFRKLYDQNGIFAQEWQGLKVRPLALTSLAPNQIASTKGSTILTAADFAGMKVRTSGSALNFLAESLGALPIQMPGADMYTAMQRKTVDGNMIALSAMSPYSLQEVTASVSKNASFGAVVQTIAISEDSFTQLSPEIQTVLDTCGRSVEVSLMAWLDQNDAKVAADFSAAGVNVFEFTPQEQAMFAEKTAQVAETFVARLTARNIPGDKAYEELQAVLAK